MEEDLKTALDTGLIKGAKLDTIRMKKPQVTVAKSIVFGKGDDDVIITPHTAFYSTSSIEDLEKTS